MAEISAALVKQLREQTGAGMMDCKKALAESDGDIEAATDWLRKKGLSKAQKKAGRATAEGLIAVRTAGPRGAMVEVNAETDFVARNDQFQGFVEGVAELALNEGGDMESLKAATYPATGRRLDEELTQQIATIGENLDLRRMAYLTVEQGIVAGYCHSQIRSGLGKMGVLVAVESDGDQETLHELGRNIAMHIAAASPTALSREDIDASEVERERNVLAEQARASGKPENIIEKMVEGRLRKFYEENCLLEQDYVVDGESKVHEVVERTAQQLGKSVQVTAFRRFTLGEGKATGSEESAEAQPASA